MMEAIYHAFQHWMLCACLAGLGIIAALLFLAKVAAPAWDAVRRWWSLPCIQRVIVAVCVVGLSYYGATKQGWHVAYDGGIKAGATANVVTNDTVSIHWQRDTSGGVYVPETATVYIDAIEHGSSNVVNIAQTTVGAWGWSGTVQNATNYDYNAWAYYIPPEPVHTNGVWTYKTHFDRNGEYALPLRARVEVNGVAIATPAEKRKDAERVTAKSYIQDGLIAMWDGIENVGWGTHDPNATVWKDLIGNCDADTDPNLVHDNYMQEDGSNNMKALTSADKIDFSRLTFVTFEACFLNEKNNANYHMAIGASSDYFSIGYPTTGSKTLSWKLGTGGRPTVTGVHGTLAAVYDNGSAGMYFNGSAGQFTTSNRKWNNTLYLMWANPWGAARGEKRCYCFRLYSRALTAEEIAHNYKIDKERFNLP